jgi:hypothetical protein
MKTLRQFLSRLRGLFGAAGIHADRERELASHLAMLTEQFEKRGLTPAEARREPISS